MFLYDLMIDNRMSNDYYMTVFPLALYTFS